MKNNGELLQPPTDLRDVPPQLEAGCEYAWKPEARRWRILVAPPADCGDPCRELARELDLVWRPFGKTADALDILWLGPPPAGPPRHAARPAEPRVGKACTRTSSSRLSPYS